ncbi:MAG: hypothetical protein ACOY3P_23625 [Planctomycetota bacterium]
MPVYRYLTMVALVLAAALLTVAAALHGDVHWWSLGRRTMFEASPYFSLIPQGIGGGLLLLQQKVGLYLYLGGLVLLIGGPLRAWYHGQPIAGSQPLLCIALSLVVVYGFFNDWYLAE